ncbi:hypothetical protein GCM10027347_52470 [Larkinella harenae]
MPLTPVDPRVKKANAQHLNAAKADDERHRLHAEAATDAASASPYWNRLVDKIITPSIVGKGQREQMLRQIFFPLCSNEVVDDISDACSAVHYAQDRNITVECRDEKLQRDFEQYLERINLNGFISNECHNAHFEAPNSLVVVDLPEEQTTDFPEPYLYLLNLDQVIAVEAQKLHQQAGKLVFAFFKHVQEGRRITRAGLYDSEAYSIYVKEDGSGEWKLKNSFPHNLGHTPVFKLWSDVSSTNPLLSNTVLRPLLGKLDSYVIEEGSFRALRLSSSNPIFWFLETSDTCDYSFYNDNERHFCQKGAMMVTIDGQSVGTGKACPRCSARRILGPGSRIPIPAQQTKEDADWRVPADWINVDVNALKFHQDFISLMRSDIVRTATGYDGGPVRNEAINEDQIGAILERARQIGQYMATHYENLTRNLIDTIGKLRYGTEYIGCNVDFGRRYTILTGDQLTTLYDAAKKAGMSDWVLEEIDSMMQDFYGRNDASKRLRYKMINDLNPYPYKSPSELRTAGINTLDPYGYMVSTGLMGLIARFERENRTFIERFGLATDYNKRISTIYETLYSYVKSTIETRPDLGLETESGSQQGGGKPKPKREPAKA